jgi:SAM-dependent methyltransferase
VDFSSYEGTYYRAIGDFLREAYLELPFTQGTDAEVDFLEKELALPVGALILDVGCGPGRHALELARRGYHTTGIDISAGFIDVADMCARHDNLPATFRVADARDLPFPSLPLFDAAICLCQGAFGMVGGEDSHRLVLREVHRVLKPASLLVIGAVHGYAVARRAGFDPETGVLTEEQSLANGDGETRRETLFTTTFTPRELTLLLEGAGFVVEDLYGCAPGHFSRRPVVAEDVELLAVARRM